METLIAEETRACSICCQVLPLASFPKRSSAGPEDGLDSRCRPCLAAIARDRRQLKKRRQLRALSRELSQTRDARQAIRLAARTVERMGGVERVAAAWSEHITLVLKERPGSRAAVQGLHSLLMLTRAAADARKALADRSPRPDLAQLEIDELRAELASIFAA